MGYHIYSMWIRVQTGIAMAGGLFIIYSFTRFVELRTKGFKLVFYLVLCDVLANSVALSNNYPPSQDDPFCIIQGSVIQFFGLAAFLWTLMISCTLYAAVSRTCHGQRSFLDKFIHNDVLVHSVIWSLSGVSIIVPIFTNSIGPTGYTCWILETPTPFGTIWRFLFFYLVAFLTILTTMYQSYKIRGWVESLVMKKVQEEMRLRGLSLPQAGAGIRGIRSRGGSAAVKILQQHANIIKLHHQLKWYPIVLTISWFYRCACRLNEALSLLGTDQSRYFDTDRSTPGLLFIFAGGFAMQGTLNFFIYGLTPAVRKAWYGLWVDVVVEGNITSVTRFESYAVNAPADVEYDDSGYDPRYADSESDEANNGMGYEMNDSYNQSSFYDSDCGQMSSSGVEQRLSASLEMGKHGTPFQKMSSFGNKNPNVGGQTDGTSENSIVTTAHHI